MAGPDGGNGKPMDGAGPNNAHGGKPMDGTGQQPDQAPGPNDAGYTYTGPGAHQQDDTNKDLHQQIRENNHGHHLGPQYTGAANGYYKVNIDELRGIHNQLSDMVEAAESDRNQARRIAGANSPASDPDGSVMHVKALRKWGDELHREVEQHYKALTQYRDNLKKIIDQYGANEHDATVTFKDFQGKL